MALRGFDAKYLLEVVGKKTTVINGACWSQLYNMHTIGKEGLNSYYSRLTLYAQYFKKEDLQYVREKTNNPDPKNSGTPILISDPKHISRYVYITKYTYDETKEYIPLLVSLINGITECEIVKIEDDEYIKFQLLKTYDQSLVLLSFIRNLWHNPNGSNNPSFIKVFFDTLKNDSTYEDCLSRLMHANIIASKTCKGFMPGNHCNALPAGEHPVKKAKDLYAYTGSSTQGFLTK